MKRRYYMLVASVPAVLSAHGVLAQESGTANSAVVSAMTTAANDMTATATSIIPVALGVLTLGLVVVFGIRMFKKVSGQRG